MKKLAAGFIAIIGITVYTHAQNVGIGTNTPGFKLDVNGRMRIRHTSGSTAGLLLDGPTTPTRSFIGSLDDDHVGIFGNGGAGWNLVMNVENGNTGIGVTAPTARLDVNGSFRFRSNDASSGAVLRSVDGLGNVGWQRVYSFRVTGLANAQNQDTDKGKWNKVIFATSASHNLGLSYQPAASQFVAPVNGIYHFDAHLKTAGQSYQTGLALNIIRSGTEFTVASDYHGDNRDGGDFTTKTVQVSIDIQLVAGDIVYVLYYGNASNANIEHGHGTWFSGHLIAQL